MLWTSACSGSTDGTGVKREPPPKAGLGESCAIDVDCRDPLFCMDGACAARGETPEGSPCQITAECGDGLYCEQTTASCAAAGMATSGTACSTTADCAKGLVCAPRGLSAVCAEGGDLDVGNECTSLAECLPGLGCGPPLGGNPGDPYECQSGPAGLPLPWIGVQCPDPGSDPATTALFNVPGGDDDGTFYEFPFPNDFYLDNGHPNITNHPTPGAAPLGFDIVQTYLEEIAAKQDHYGTNPAVFFRFDGRIDFDTVEVSGSDDERTLFLVDLNPTSERYGQRRGMSWVAATGAGRYICNNWISARSPWGRPLDARTTYAVVLTTGVRADGGGMIAQSADFAAMLADSAPADDHLKVGYEAYAPLRDWIGSGAIDAADIINAAVFTTGDPFIVTGQLRDVVRTQDVTASELTLCDEGVTSPCDDGLEGDDNIRKCSPRASNFSEIHGKLSLPVFQEGEPPYLEEGGAISLDGGRPAVVRTEDVCMAMTVPDLEMPQEGWPVLIYAHGTGGSFRGFTGQVSGLLSDMTVDDRQVGMLVVGWDQVLHFTRRGDSDLDPEGLVYNFANPDAANGNFVQGAADLFALTAFVETLNIPAADSPTGEEIRVDPTKIYFFGHSQGATTGPLALPFEPLIQGTVLSGAGAGLIHALLGKTSPVDIVSATKIVLQDPDVGSMHPILNLIQMFFDPVDPLNYAQYIGARELEGMTTRRHVFQSVGIGDTFTPNASLETLAIALRLSMINPYDFDNDNVNATDLPASGNIGGTGGPWTVVGRQYDTDGTFDGHFVLFRNSEGQDDVAEFLGTAVVRGTPEIAD